ncbi:hypothetical protein Q8A67_015594 [Cirrhinus molitorella]|uniref:Fucolectin tachylectin-4 pentraxin-1 domain-containing protein n=1 Tax=Cirrhinus molitorella TaxID=172907 RepID=A0AA88PLI0_9TELE|nr:hypothetical protein Q8A67_015594 [Cirrhinus molitorella]
MKGVLVILLLTLFPVLCIAHLTGNIAFHAKAVQSSKGHELGDAEHAVDGNKETDYMKGSCTHTDSELDPWWRVDLKDVYSVSKVIITTRVDCCQDRITGAQIRIGNSLENNGNSNKLAVTLSTAPKGTETFEFKSIKGRYVNIFLPGKEKTLTLCEVEVYAEKEELQSICVPRNRALQGKAVQSSTYDEQGYAQNAIDGKEESVYSLGSCSHTEEQNDPWWRVDLKKSYSVTRVIITNREDCCSDRIKGAQIRIGNSLNNDGNENKWVASIGFISAGGTESIGFKPIEGRYVNIFLPGKKKILTLCEVQVLVA